MGDAVGERGQRISHADSRALLPAWTAQAEAFEEMDRTDDLLQRLYDADAIHRVTRGASGSLWGEAAAEIERLRTALSGSTAGGNDDR